MDTAEHTLVLSWSGVLLKLFNGSVSFDELDGALYYFGCMRPYAFNPRRYINGRAQLDAFFGPKSKRGQELHRQLMQMVEQAEQEGRVAWRTDKGVWANYPQLNELLAKFDLPAIPFDEKREFDVNHPRVESVVEEHRLPYRLIC